MKSRSVFFTGPRRVEVRSEELPEPKENEVVVATEVSAVSAGSELLVFRGQLEEGTALDESLPALASEFRYPLRYGYSAAGRIVDLGPGVPVEVRGRRVFAFEPHRSHFRARLDELRLLPEGFSAEAASLLPTVETAVNLALDGRPLLGERVLVVGQGIVGLAATAVLSRFPLERLWTVDPLPSRRRLSRRLGAHEGLAPYELDARDFDLTFELSGSPAALSLALQSTGTEGRVVVGSWYGDKRASVDLGTHFHRGRLTILSSQVSRLGPQVAARWDKKRRLDTASDLLGTLPVEELVSHRFPLEEASRAFQLLDEKPEECLQVLLTYT